MQSKAVLERKKAHNKASKKIKSRLRSIVYLANKLREKGYVDGVESSEKPLNDNIETYFDYIEIFKLNFDLYQRLIDPKVINKAKTVNKKLLVPIIVWVRPTGELVVSDGQHKTVLTYLSLNDPNYKVPCWVYVHPTNMSEVACIKEEAAHMKILNTITKHYRKLDTLRSDLITRQRWAIEVEEKLEKMNLVIEFIGSKRNDAIKITSGFDSAIAAFEQSEANSIMSVKLVNDWYISSKKKNIKTSIVLALTYILNMYDVIKHDNLYHSHAGVLLNFINNEMKSINLTTLLTNTSGNVGYKLIARKIISVFNKNNPDFIIPESVLSDNELEDPSVM